MFHIDFTGVTFGLAAITIICAMVAAWAALRGAEQACRRSGRFDLF